MDPSCTICKEVFIGSGPFVTTDCGHILHEKCMKEWVAARMVCPSCWSHRTTADYFPVYFSKTLFTEMEKELSISRMKFGTDEVNFLVYKQKKEKLIENQTHLKATKNETIRELEQRLAKAKDILRKLEDSDEERKQLEYKATAETLEKNMRKMSLEVREMGKKMMNLSHQYNQRIDKLKLPVNKNQHQVQNSIQQHNNNAKKIKKK